MKQRALALAIKRIIWAELAFSAALAVPAFAQSQPAAAGNTAATPSVNSATPPATNPATSATSGAANSSAANPAPSSKEKVQQIKTFEVTGSLIRSADKVGFNQVQKITAKDIENSGYTNVADYLRGVSANSASSWGEGSTNSFAPGGAGIALRGLSEKYTLVLVDGQRVAPYAFAVNGTDQFFDVNTLPLNIIDRIEIVKTGAVSQYGSDAIAGVVNIITKHNFQGLELGGSYGGATQNGGGQGTTRFSILGGIGDLNSDRFNVTAALSYYKSNGFLASDRDTTQNQDFSNQPGGLSNQSPSYWKRGNGIGNVPLSPCPNGGTVVSGNANAQTFGAGGTVCQNNTAYATSLSPWTERLSAKVHADFKINDAMQAFADLWESNNTTNTNNFVGRLSASTQTYDPATGGVNLISNVVPASNPYNPFGVPTQLRYAFPATQSVRTSSNFWRAATGVKGSFTTPGIGDWDWSAAYTHSQNTVSNDYTNLINANALTNIIQNGVFDFANPAATPNGLNGLYGSTSTQAITKLDALDLTLATPHLFTLPTGDVGLGFGTQFLHQSQYIGTGAGYVNGTYINPSIQSVDGERNVAAAYYQVDIPLLTNLTFSQSGRYDHYSDFGGAFSPRFALRFQPVRQLTMYGSYTRGFRAPTLIENTSSKTFGAQGAIDPNDPNDPGAYALREEIQAGSRNLQPERTKNYNLGFQLSPTRTTDIGFDWYKIHIDNVIGTDDIQSVVNANDPSKVIRNPNGSIAYVLLPYQNLASLDTDGFETTFRQSVATRIGTFTLSGDWTYVWHFKMPVGGVTTDFAGNNGAQNTPFGASFPRWKGNTDLNWNYQKWNATLTWIYTGPYAQAILPPGNYPGMKDGMASYSQFNLFVSYTGIKHWTLYAGVDNIFNRAPPFDPTFMNASYQSGYDTSLYSYVGRFAQIGATYKF